MNAADLMGVYYFCTFPVFMNHVQLNSLKINHGSISSISYIIWKKKKENLFKTWHCKAQVRQIWWATFE